MKSNVISFSLPSLPGKVGIDKISFDDFFNMGLEGPILPSFPPKSLLQIVSLVDAGRSDDISIFEWLDATENTLQWKGLTQDQSFDACRAIWTAICGNQALGDIAFFKAGLAIDGKPSSIVPLLLDTMSIARTVKGIDTLCAEKIDWLLRLKEQKYHELASICCSANLTPYFKTKWLRLPLANTYLSHIQDQICLVVDPKTYNDQHDNWLYDCFLSMQTTKEKINFCGCFISRFAASAYRYRCGKIIEDHCLPSNDNSYWYALSEASKAKLKKQYGLSNYYELHGISKILSAIDAEEKLGLDERKRRQIHSRTMFWSNYSKHFQRIRALLPESSFHYIAQFNNGLPPFVDMLTASESHESEVYIFELDRLIVVEFLRGALSETRFFSATDWNLKRLFDSRELSIEDIRSLSQQEVHDHLVGWQYFCEKLLRIKFKVKPTTGLPYFKGLPPSVNSYSEENGLLLSPESKLIDERKKALEYWVEQFWESEFKTGKYGEQGGLQQKSNVYLAKAQMARQLGDQVEYELFIRKAANQGNPEAMWQLGKSMLLGRHSDAKTRKFGEDWIGKAAGFAHKEAKETATKYRIPFTEKVASISQVSEQDTCLSSLAAVREWDQKKGIESAKKLLLTVENKNQLIEALVKTLARSQSSDIKLEIAGLLQSINDIKVMGDVALVLSSGIDAEQQKAIEIYEQLHDLNVDVEDKVRALVKFADDYKRKGVMISGLRMLSNLGDLGSTYKLATILISSDSPEERQIGLTLMKFAASRGHESAQGMITR